MYWPNLQRSTQKRKRSWIIMSGTESIFPKGSYYGETFTRFQPISSTELHLSDSQQWPVADPCPGGWLVCLSVWVWERRYHCRAHGLQCPELGLLWLSGLGAPEVWECPREWRIQQPRGVKGGGVGLVGGQSGVECSRGSGGHGSASGFRASGPHRSEKCVPWLNPARPQLGHSAAPSWPSIFSTSSTSLPLCLHFSICRLHFYHLFLSLHASHHSVARVPHEIEPLHQNRCLFYFNPGQIDFWKGQTEVNALAEAATARLSR